MTEAAGAGFALSLSLILAIGARSFRRVWRHADQLMPGEADGKPLLPTLLFEA